MDEMDIRNQILGEIIDQMHGRLADKAYPDEKPKEEELVAAVTEEPKKEELESEEDFSPEDMAELEKMSAEG